MLKTVIIHGQSHKGTTWRIARMLAEKTGGEITEYFLPRDFGQFCTGCTKCFMDNETLCPHYKALQPITEALDTSDIIILASPVYVYHATGAMKSFLDHYGYRWMVHSPEPSMFRKQGVCIATAAGGGMRSATKDMADSLFYWGVARIERLGLAVAATSWDSVSDKKKAVIDRKTTFIARRIAGRAGHAKPGLRTKAMFAFIRMMMKKGWNKRDVRYWNEHGWLDKARPWKQSPGREK